MDFPAEAVAALAMAIGAGGALLLQRLRRKPTAPTTGRVAAVGESLVVVDATEETVAAPSIPEPEPVVPEPEPEPVVEMVPEPEPELTVEETTPEIEPEPEPPKPVGRIKRGCECGVPGRRCGIHQGRPL